MLGVDLLPVQAVGRDRQDPVDSLRVGEGDEAEASAPLEMNISVRCEWGRHDRRQVSKVIKNNFDDYFWSANIKLYYDIALTRSKLD